MKRLIRNIVLLIAVAAISTAGLAVAQPDAGAKARGEHNFYGRSAARSLRSAREYAQDYQTYAKTAPAVDKAVAQEAADSISQYIVKAQKHMAWMRKHAATDKEALASLDVIDKSLVDAAKSHHTMHALCTKDHVESAGTMKCCNEINESLGKAIAEHDKLMKRLGLATPAVTPKK